MLTKADNLNHDNAVEYNFIIFVMQIGQVVCQPGDGIGFTAACAVLNQVVTSGAMLVYIGNQFANNIQLMIAREDHYGLLGILFVLLKMDKSLNDIQQAVLLQHFVPQIGSAVCSTADGISLATIIAFVEWQEVCIDTVQLGGHPYFVGIYSKVNQAPGFERK